MTYRTPIFNKTFEYNIKDVEIENHFDRNNWGPKLWDILHTFSYNYDENPNIQQKQNAMNFFSSICLLLPCDFCKQHCSSFIFNNPPKINSKNELINWVLLFHNNVNRRLHRNTWTRKQLDNKYNTGNAYCK
tara:strand:- start:702 stop:1097 length:396 start_codon:yes stop_codon:yes gene_type:complete